VLKHACKKICHANNDIEFRETVVFDSILSYNFLLFETSRLVLLLSDHTLSCIPPAFFTAYTFVVLVLVPRITLILVGKMLMCGGNLYNVYVD